MRVGLHIYMHLGLGISHMTASALGEGEVGFFAVHSGSKSNMHALVFSSFFSPVVFYSILLHRRGHLLFFSLFSLFLISSPLHPGG
jgi:hypothetical protein